MNKSLLVKTEIRADINTAQGIIEGYPIVFNEATSICGLYTEIIAPEALNEADLSDIKLLTNHDNSMIPLARHRRGKRSTMDVSVDEKGLKITARLDTENNHHAKELFSAVERGDIEDMSFAFLVDIEGDEWSDFPDAPIRRITKISKVREVSAVNDGAYPQTEIYARSQSALDNEKQVLQEAYRCALDNDKSRKSLELKKKKFAFMEEQKRL